MISLDYKLSASWKRSWETINLAEATESDLLYRALLGDILFKVDASDFSANWGWIPIIDFAASLRNVVTELGGDDKTEATFDFTESDAIIRFKRVGKTLILSASYVSGEASLSFRDFVTSVDMFANRVGRELREQYPQLRQNKSFLQLLPESMRV